MHREPQGYGYAHQGDRQEEASLQKTESVTFRSHEGDCRGAFLHGYYLLLQCLSLSGVTRGGTAAEVHSNRFLLLITHWYSRSTPSFT
jgi:hypothetical protein